jgi:hypothetical protein
MPANRMKLANHLFARQFDEYLTLCFSSDYFIYANGKTENAGLHYIEGECAPFWNAMLKKPVTSNVISNQVGWCCLNNQEQTDETPKAEALHLANGADRCQNKD